MSTNVKYHFESLVLAHPVFLVFYEYALGHCALSAKSINTILEMRNISQYVVRILTKLYSVLVYSKNPTWL